MPVRPISRRDERDADVELGVGERLERAREVVALGLEVVLEAQREPSGKRSSAREFGRLTKPGDDRPAR